jgi:hypothetical protein
MGLLEWAAGQLGQQQQKDRRHNFVAKIAKINFF